MERHGCGPAPPNKNQNVNLPALASLYSRPLIVQMVLACTVAFVVPPWMNPTAQGQTVSDASRLGSFFATAQNATGDE